MTAATSRRRRRASFSTASPSAASSRIATPRTPGAWPLSTPIYCARSSCRGSPGRRSPASVSGCSAAARLSARYKENSATDMKNGRLRTLRVVLPLLAMVGVMVVAVSYSVTLYSLFCAATGFGGTTRRVAADEAKLSNRVVTVLFSTDISPDLPWRFEPVQREVKVRLGEETLVFFTAQNLTQKPLIGHATYNVTPTKAGPYFNKIQCFCFTEEK